MRYSMNLRNPIAYSRSAFNRFKSLSRYGQIGLLAVAVVMLYGGIHIAATWAAAPAVSLTTLGVPYTQNFDSLATTGTANTWTDDTTIVGLYSQFTATTTNPTTYRADAGGSNTGAIYSWGTGTATERALGSVGSGGTGDIYNAIKFTNNTGATITSLVVSYTGEQWRQGGCTPTPCTPASQKLDFQYQAAAAGTITDANTPTTGWLDHDALDFTSPQPGTSTAAAVDGNAAANRTALSATVSVTVSPGQEIWLRWKDINDTNNDHGLAIDDLSVTPNGGIALPNLTINDVSLNEGNAGTTSFTFTVSLSAPAGPGGVTFDIATADGTATQPSDYTQKSLTAQTIPAGSSTYSFTVLVNGDITPETNETFFVNITNVTGATVTDGQGQGTIVNDDAAPNLTINDVSLNEGNAGTTTFTFTVSLSAPAGAGGVTFDIATANNSAVAPGDYTAKSLTSQTIPAGSSTYTFDVLVNGDTTPETDETFFVNLTNITNAIGTDTQGQGTIVNDDIAKIHDVQGNGAATPIPGSTVTVEGIVVANFQGTNKLQGFFLEEENADFDADPATSEGIFIFCSSCPTAVAEGQRVKATGVVSEFNNLTEITASTAGSVVITNAGNNLAQVSPSTIDLPIVGVVNDFYEAREGMLVTFVDSLSVSEYFELFRYGQIELYEGGRPRQFTETTTPSVAGYAAHLDGLNRRKVILDDTNNVQNAPLTLLDGSQFIFHPVANGGLSIGTQGLDFFRGGDTVNNLTGVLHWSFAGQTGTDAWRIRPTNANPVTFTVANPRPATPPSVGGAIKVAGMNLLNYFTTIDTTSSDNSGPCGPSGTQDCRGADSVAELNRQRERASIVICTMNADIYGFAELENTTPSASITDLLGAVNTLCGGAHPYAFVNTGGTLGTDAIRVQQIYRTGVVSPVGSPLSDLDPIHSRPPTAQTFDVVDATNPAFGKRFTVIINHLKSKGSSAGLPGDADIGDGAGASNATRTAQANRLMSWINSTVIPAAGDPDVLLLGDFNAYAKEDPITALIGGGYTDLEALFQGANAYSYLFDGQLGHLDYGFANAALLPQVTGADAWHINADESDLFDYNDETKDVGEAAFEEKPDGSALVPPRVVFQPGTPYRASDHDPVLVGLFQVADLSVTKTASPSPVTVGANLTYTITVTNAGPDTAASASLSDTLPAGTTFVSLSSPGGWSCTTPSVGSSGTVSCSNPSFAPGSGVFTLIVKVGTPGTVMNTATVASTTSDPNTGNNSGTATVTANCPTITVNPTILPVGTAGSPYSPVQFTQSGGNGTITWSVSSNNLPAGLTLNSMSGILSGTPTVAVGVNVTIRATDANNCFGEATVTLQINCPNITISPSSGSPTVLTGATVGQSYTQTFTAAPAGNGYTYSIPMPAIPPGLTFNTSTGELSGIPTTSGTFGFTVTATAFGICTGQQAYSLTIIPACPTSFTVNDLSDVPDQTPGDRICSAANGACTLRAAIMEANAITACTPLTINFSVTGTINLATALPAINHPNLTINGPGANQLDVHRNAVAAFRIFAINGGKIVSISGLSVTNGNDPVQAGGIYNAGTLTLTACAISGNTSPQGAGIQSDNILTMTSCTVSNNIASDFAGGLKIFGPTTTLTNCTFSNNQSAHDSSAIESHTGVTLTLTNCTIANNQAGTGSGQTGGALFANSGTVLKNTIVANNSGNNANIAGPVDTANSFNNLIGAVGTGGLTNGVNGNQVGVANANTLLAALGNYGGTTQTIALLPGSPAINAGTSSGAPATDQRGIARVGNVDIGAFESRGFALAISSGNNQSTPVNTNFASPLSVSVTSANSEPVNGGRVTFTPPGSGASATIAGNPATITGGLATSGTVTANAIFGGPYNVAASAAGATSVNFSLTNTPGADLAITKTDGVTSYTPGGTLTYTIVVSNAGPSIATGAIVTDNKPTQVAQWTWVCSGVTGGATGCDGVTNTAANFSDTINLPAGSSITYTVTTTTSSSATGNLVNTASVAVPGGTTDPTPGNNSATDTDTPNPVADLSVTKTDGVAIYSPGGTQTYTIVVSNTGPSNVTSALVTDNKPTQVTQWTWVCSGVVGGATGCDGVTNTAANFSDTINLPAGSSITYTVTAIIAAAPSGNLVNTVIVAPPAGTTDPTGGNNSATDTDTLISTPAALSGNLTDPLICTGPGNVIAGTIQLNNPLAAQQAFVLTTAFNNFVGIPGSCTLTGALAGASCTVTAGGLSASGNMPPNGTLTVQYQAQVGDVAPGTTLTASSVATVGGVPATPNPLIITTTVNCPAPGPGGVFPSAAETSDQKAGSVLIYNVYTSGATSGNTQNTRINITNTHMALPSYVHLFFIAENCGVADSYICLTANQTASFLANDLDPGTTGYIVAVATNNIGCPINFNYLIGDEYVKFTTGHAANLAAQAFSALPGGLPPCDGNTVITSLNFDGVSYNRAPATLAVDNIASRADGNDTMLILNRIGGNLGLGTSTIGTLFGILYNDAENAVSFSVNGSCQLRGSLSNNFPRTTPRFDGFIAAGRTGWLKIYEQTGAIGLSGAVINFNPNPASSVGAFSQGHNLHVLTLTTGMSYILPVFPPNC